MVGIEEMVLAILQRPPLVLTDCSIDIVHNNPDAAQFKNAIDQVSVVGFLS